LILIPENIDSKYRFVILSALRARQIQGGSMPMIKDNRHKSTRIAQKELLAGLVKFRFQDAEERKRLKAEAQEAGS
jgi:DNA-directed RNA polymerase omega subunit